VAANTNNRKIRGKIIVAVFIDVVQLDVKIQRVADAAGMLVVHEDLNSY
jgi:hypothetical protein